MNGFSGTWTIDIDSSKVWDATSQRYLPDRVGSERITIHERDGVQDYEVLYGDAPTFRMGYTSRYDAPEWVPYEVREILNVPAEGIEASTEAFRRRIHADSGAGYRRLELGKPYALVRIISGDPWTHYRIAKDAATGIVTGIMPRRLAKDGQSYVATVIDSQGTVFRVRRFVRV